MKNKVLLDIDGVIANFYAGFGSHLNHTLNAGLNLNLEPNDYSIHRWSQVPLSNKSIDAEIPAWIAEGGYKDMPIYPRAKEFTLELMDKYDVFVVTARVGDFRAEQLGGFPKEIIELIKLDTYKWFKDHGIPSDKLFFEHRKIDFCKENGISVLIEDKLDTVVKAAMADLKPILISRAWNQKIGGEHEPLIVSSVYPADSYSEVFSALGHFFGRA